MSQWHNDCDCPCVITHLLFFLLWAGEGTEATQEGSEQKLSSALGSPSKVIYTCDSLQRPAWHHLPLSSLLPFLFPSSHPGDLPSVCPSYLGGEASGAFGVSTLNSICCQTRGRDLEERSLGLKGVILEPHQSLQASIDFLNA